MCACLDSTNRADADSVALAADRQDNSTPREEPPATDIQNAMAELRSALHSRKVEPICAAYQQLHLAAPALPAPQLCKMVGESLGPTAMTMIISAYSHRQCYMCADGTIPCETCHGTGEMSPGRKCPNCDGLAALTCGFCRGTNWADHETVPREIRAIVSRRQRTHAQSELPALTKILAQLTPQKAAATSLKSRQDLARWLSRVHSRLAAVVTDPDTPQGDQMQLSILATEAEKLLEMLRRL